MFTRRSRILLAALLLFCGVLVARAAQVQVAQHGAWDALADEAMRRATYLPTTRGRILDVRGRVLAEDRPSVDVCVDYRAAEPDPDDRWVARMARLRLRGNPAYDGATYERRKRSLAAEVVKVRADVAGTWALLADVGRVPVEQVESARRQIVETVEGRRASAQRRALARDRRAFESRGPTPWWLRWAAGGTARPPAEGDYADLVVAEENDDHVVLPAVTPEANNALYKRLDRYPWLSLRPGTTRVYPYRDVACHVIGRLSGVTREDLNADPNADDALRRYGNHDLIGRTGLESIWERELRGTRGRIERDLGADESDDDAPAAREVAREVARVEPVAGRDVRSSIDVALQEKVTRAFDDVLFRKASPARGEPEVRLPMPGAAVVIDVATGQVRAMVSAPTYDLNAFDREFPALVADAIDRPLMNRATQFALEPGSTVKTVVGLGAITAGLIGPADTIECTGYMQSDGVTYRGVGKCWTMSMYHVGHHQTPWAAPHPTGFLTFADALERSCNVFFETLGDRAGVAALSGWMRNFGLGRPTGVGLPEVDGVLADELPAGEKSQRWFAAIGQGIAATPIQMANVAATIARDGVWERPTLATSRAERPPRPAGDERPDRLDLRLDPGALAAVHLGMFNVVNAPAGTGKTIERPDLLLAGKTGTAQAAALYERTTGPDGAPVNRRLRMGTNDAPNPEVPWYRGDYVTREGGDGSGGVEEVRDHSWYIGYAPADRPTVAFACFVEYGGSGGTAAGSVAEKVIQALVEEGYLTPRDVPAAPEPVELLSPN